METGKGIIPPIGWGRRRGVREGETKVRAFGFKLEQRKNCLDPSLGTTNGGSNGDSTRKPRRGNSRVVPAVRTNPHGKQALHSRGWGDNVK